MTNVCQKLLIAVASILLLRAAAPAQDLFTLEDLRVGVTVSAARLSPQRDEAVLVLGRKDFERNRNELEMALFDLVTKERRTLAQGRAGLGDPQWSPDGASVAFLANATEGRRIFTLPRTGGEPAMLATEGGAVRAFAWSRDGSRLAYIATDPAKKPGFNDSFEVGSQDFLATGPSPRAGLWVHDVATKTSQRLTPPEVVVGTVLSTSRLSWSPAGDRILITSFASADPGDSDRAKLFEVEVETKRLSPLTGNASRESDGEYSRDGRVVFFVAPRDGVPANQPELHVLDRSTRAVANLGRLIDRGVDARQPAGAAGVLLLADHGLRSGLWLFAGQKARTLELGELTSVSRFDAADRGTMILVGATERRPTELYWKRTHDAVPERVTDLNGWVTKKRLGRSEGVAWESSNGLHPNGIVTYPPDFDPKKAHPLVLYVHGGPSAASLLGFQAFVQALAAKGWIVFQPNYRGSTNLGNTFQSAIANDAGEGPGHDVITGVRRLLERPYVDRTRVAVTGWSYGGFMTAWLIGRYPDVWRAAVAGAAPVDVTDMYSLNDLNRTLRHAITGSPYQEGALAAAWAQSPISHFGRIRTPTLVMSNTGDARVPVTGSYKLYGALRDNGVPVQFIAYPASGHFPSDPVRGLDVYQRWIGWIEKQFAETGRANSPGR
jgi:dipeptidyl aminopeptidase/acylaminoacyl peptidase